MNEGTDPKHGLEALNKFTSGRWLWNEKRQLAYRYVKFDLSALLQIASSAVGSKSCTQVLKISEGQYNKVFQITMDDGHEIIAKLPNPNAGRPHFTTVSEVATMDFLPVLRVYTWSSRTSENPLGAEYIIMEKQAGVVLTDVWDSLKGRQKAQVLDQIVDIQRRLAGARIARFGSLYYVIDIPDNAGPDSSLYFDLAGNELRSKRFCIGPTNHRSFFDFGRGELDIDRGPWSTVTEVIAAIAEKEIATAKAGIRYLLMPEGLFHGPRQYQPSISKKLPALENYLKVAPHVMPENQATHASVIWHGDLHSQNIFVNPEEPSQILGIIDWQSSSVHPLFMQVGRPAFLDYNGPVPKDLGKIPLPSNIDQMDADEQRKGRELQRAQTLHNLYLVRCLQADETVFQALQNQSTLRHQVSVVPGLVLMDYEPLLNSLLRDVQKEWAQIVGIGDDGSSPRTPCPLQFSAEEVQQQEEDGELWAQGIALMDTFIADTGCFKHWDGRVDEIDCE
ncbi:phosphotransferase family protein [Aspergillus luchuensis]|uniref:Altered inheritance of mitochondria protein 9, mitochondrial n=1 Tax=Aspergillus kawachii TaxID=1069201 RepID=A0A7R7ZW37_ASPKA|nr:uncharacterized protein AKAW2_21620S [Aspergillus luchuensis]BCR96680.1 hypothetical protein AKAW2_21620S [Aspergillus luchuensis]